MKNFFVSSSLIALFCIPFGVSANENEWMEENGFYAKVDLVCKKAIPDWKSGFEATDDEKRTNHIKLFTALNKGDCDIVSSGDGDYIITENYNNVAYNHSWLCTDSKLKDFPLLVDEDSDPKEHATKVVDFFIKGKCSASTGYSM